MTGIRKMPQISLNKIEGSYLDKYKKRVVGSSSIYDLLKYEVLTSIFGSLPGGAGILLRKYVYKRLFSKSNNVTFGRHLTIRHPSKIFIDKGTIIDDFCVLDAKSERNPGIIIGEKCLLSRNATISTGYKGYVRIGKNTIIGASSLLQGPGGIDIGENVLIGDQTVLNAGKHIYEDPELPILEQGITMEGISVGDDVWIGTGVIVTDGVTISKGSIIEPGSLVNTSILPYSVAAGSPAKIIKFRK
jgi:acetyltransferase-like isoleucine patch superfamily enzyme